MHAVRTDEGTVFVESETVSRLAFLDLVSASYLSAPQGNSFPVLFLEGCNGLNFLSNDVN